MTDEFSDLRFARFAAEGLGSPLHRVGNAVEFGGMAAVPQRMERMSAMMHRMSGLESRPAMKDSESQKQMDLMKKQMDEMMRDMPMGAKSK